MARLHVTKSQTGAVGSSSVVVATGLIPNVIYTLIANTGCWIAQGATPTAVAHGATAVYVPAGFPIEVCGDDGAEIAAIQDTAGGFLSVVASEL